MMIRERKNGTVELRIKHRLLAKPFYATFDDETSARNYGSQLEAMLKAGIVPAELASQPRGSSITFAALARIYESTMSLPASDVALLRVLKAELGSLRVDKIMLTYSWAESWVRSLKLDSHLAPGSIRHRVGALARVLDWHIHRSTPDGILPISNPLRLLPRRYSTYSDHERRVLEQDGREAKKDIERDRRLHDDEEPAILMALRGERRPDRERPLDLPEGDALLDLYHLIVNTGLRLREAYRLRVRDLNFDHKTIHVGHSKTGAKRDVPIQPAISPMLKRRVLAAKGKQSPIFPWWSGENDAKELAAVTAQLSRAFARAFAYAGCEDLREHDLRHEATCRWVTMRDKEGGWLFRAEEVMRITGHKDARTFMRYVSLRGSDLASRLWK